MWTCVVALAGAAGVWTSVMSSSLGATVFVFLFVAVGGACARLLITDEDQPPQWRRAVRTGLVSSAVVVAAGGLLAWLGLTGLALVALLALGTPRVWTAATRRWRLPRQLQRPARGERPSSSSGLAAPVWHDDAERRLVPVPLSTPGPLKAPWMECPAESMDDVTLCFAWRTSYVALQRPLPLPARLRVVERRQMLLDELERRNAHGFSAWLASGARAAGDPSRYIRTSADRRKHEQR